MRKQGKILGIFKVTNMTNPAWELLDQRFSTLLASPLNPETAPQALEDWLSLNRALYQTRGELIRAYYAHSTDAQVKGAHDNFVRNYFPKLAAASKQFIRRVAARGLNYPTTWQQFVEAATDDQPSDDLLALQGEENQLGKSFQQIRASTLYLVDGEEVQPGQLAAKLQHPNREERRKAYLGLIGSEHQKDDELDDLFVELHRIRTRIAEQSGYANYYDYALAKGPLRNKAYTPQDTVRFRESVKKYIVPLFLELRRLRKQSLGVTELRPWDNMLNPFGGTPMAQFTDDVDALSRAAKVLDRLDTEFGDVFRDLESQDLIDIESRPDKARNGYSSILPETEQSFVIMHIGPRSFNIHLLFHELGHAIHYAMAPKGQPYEVYTPPLEFAEFVSQTFELVTTPLLWEFFEQEDLKVVNYLLLERICFEILNTCKLDEFQEKVYQEQSLNKSMITVIYEQVDAQYPTGVEWGDAAHLRPYFWKNFTLFSSPFYRFEYAVAWVTALQFQSAYQKNPGGALSRLKSAMRLGYTRPTRELFREAGVDLQFNEEVLAHTSNDLRSRMMVR
ncbi:M3 family metallopeptidase [Deinococcus planocerae]|uniref:M3 family metallopeptidase n=1 Tax=Deinococcus planocerae TaxID=1737569 RepID=UPI000C7EB4AA|nr:M3 family metallopeptidase [Deinococcus planocerae]